MKEEYLLTDTLEYTNEPYAIAKIAGIKMCESYNIQYNTNFIAVQPTNLYGPNDNFDLEKSHVLPALIRKIHLGKALINKDWDIIRKDLDKLPIENINGSNSENEILEVLSKYGLKRKSEKEESDIQIEIWGSGKPMREFLWSEDMADACIHLMMNINFKDIVKLDDLRLKNQEIRNSHINIGSGKDISIKQLAEMIKSIIGFKGELYYNTDKPDGTLKKLTDTTKLTNLNWKYTVEIEEGIDRLYNWYLKYL